MRQPAQRLHDFAHTGGQAVQLFVGKRRRILCHAEILFTLDQHRLSGCRYAWFLAAQLCSLLAGGATLEEPGSREALRSIPPQPFRTPACSPMEPSPCPAPVVQHQGGRVGRDLIALQQSADPMERLGRLFSIGHIALIKAVADAEAIFTIEDVAQSHLA